MQEPISADEVERTRGAFTGPPNNANLTRCERCGGEVEGVDSEADAWQATRGYQLELLCEGCNAWWSS